MTEYLSPAELLALQNEPPLREIIIHGRAYALGTASAEQCAEIDGIGIRLANGTASASDKWPGHILKALLIAGDPHVDLSSLKDIPRDIVLAANKEFMRQRVVAALDPGTMSGRG